MGRAGSIPARGTITTPPGTGLNAEYRAVIDPVFLIAALTVTPAPGIDHWVASTEAEALTVLALTRRQA